MSNYKDIKTNKPNPLDFPAQYQEILIPQTKNYPPRAFQEYEPIAYIRDLLTLQQRTVRWLTGSDDIYMISALLSGGELSYGFAPFGPDGKLNTKYYGLSTMHLTDMLNTHTLLYNFFGKGLKISNSESCSSQVNIQMRVPRTVSNLGTQDGTTDGNAYITTSSYIGKGTIGNNYPISAYWIKNWDIKTGDTVQTYHYNTSGNTLIIDTPDFINFISNGTFFVITLSANPTNLPKEVYQWTVQSEKIAGSKQNVPLTEISSNIILAGYNQHIKMSIKDWQNDDCDTYKGKIHLEFNLDKLFEDDNLNPPITPRRFNVTITHHNYQADKLPSYNNWEEWQKQDTIFKEYIIDHTFTWKSDTYVFIQQDQISYESLSCSLSNLSTYTLAQQQYIYAGNLQINILGIKNLYNLLGAAPIQNTIQISTSISDKIYTYNSTDFYPSANIFDVQNSINFNTSFPIKQNTYGKLNSFNLAFTLNNGYTSSYTFLNLPFDNISAIVNTLSGKYLSNDLEEYFYDVPQIKKYQKQDTQYTPAQIIAGSGLFNNTESTVSYIREFQFEEKTIPTGIINIQNITCSNNNIQLNNGILFIENCKITDLENIQLLINNTWQSITNYLTTSLYKNNNLLINFILPQSITNTLQVKLITNKPGLICTAIKLKFYDQTKPTLQQMQLEIFELQEKLK